MPSTTLPGPFSFADTQNANITPTWVTTAELEMALQDALDPLATGMVALHGDLAGTGTDEMRVTFVDGLGYAERMSALASETSRPSPSTVVLGYSTLTIASHGLAKAQTWRQSQLGKPGQFVSMDEMIRYVPMSFLATLRYLACVAGSGISSNIGSTSDDLTADDWYLLREAMINTPGAGRNGMPRATLALDQLNQLSQSFRSEPAFVQNIEAFRSVAGAVVGQVFPNWAGMGVDVMISEDVVTSGGAYLGFCGSPGFMGWGRASTSNIMIPAALDPIRVDAYGLLIYRAVDALMNRTDQIEALAEIGVACADPSVYFQRRIRSQTA